MLWLKKLCVHHCIEVTLASWRLFTSFLGLTLKKISKVTCGFPHKWSVTVKAFPFHNVLRPRQHGRRFADDTFKRLFLNENVIISIKISLKFFPKGPIKIPAIAQIMAWRRPGDRPLSEPMMVSFPTHICVTRTQ